jgi:hypothetical protein
MPYLSPALPAAFPVQKTSLQSVLLTKGASLIAMCTMWWLNAADNLDDNELSHKAAGPMDRTSVM